MTTSASRNLVTEILKDPEQVLRLMAAAQKIAGPNCSKEVIHRTDPDEIAAYISEGWKIEGSVPNGIVNYSPTVYLSRSADAVVVLPDLLPCKVCSEKPTEGKIHDLPSVECCNETLGYTQRLARQNWNEQFGKIS